jgi:hypothetical protein
MWIAHNNSATDPASLSKVMGKSKILSLQSGRSEMTGIAGGVVVKRCRAQPNGQR